MAVLSVECIGRVAYNQNVVEIPRAARIHTIGDALDHMLLRDLIEYSGDSYRMVPQNNIILQYYANSIVHWKDRKSDV